MARLIYTTDGKLKGRGLSFDKRPDDITPVDIANWIKLADMAVTSPAVVGVAQLGKKGVEAAAEGVKGLFTPEAAQKAKEAHTLQQAAQAKAGSPTPPVGGAMGIPKQDVLTTDPSQLPPASKMPTLPSASAGKLSEEARAKVSKWRSEAFRSPNNWRPSEVAEILKQLSNDPKSGVKLDNKDFRRTWIQVKERQRNVKPMSMDDIEQFVLRTKVEEEQGRPILSEVEISESQKLVDQARERRAAPAPVAAPAQDALPDLPIITQSKFEEVQKGGTGKEEEFMIGAGGKLVRYKLDAQGKITDSQLVRSNWEAKPETDLVRPSGPQITGMTPDIMAREDTTTTETMVDPARKFGLSPGEQPEVVEETVEVVEPEPVFDVGNEETSRTEARDVAKTVVAAGADKKTAIALAKQVQKDVKTQGIAAPTARSLAELIALASAADSLEKRKKILLQVEGLVPTPQPKNLFQVFGLGMPDKQKQVAAYQSIVSKFMPPMPRRTGTREMRKQELAFKEKRLEYEMKRLKAQENRWKRADTSREQKNADAKKRLNLAFTKEARARRKDQRLQARNTIKEAVGQLNDDYKSLGTRMTALQKKETAVGADADAPLPAKPSPVTAKSHRKEQYAADNKRYTEEKTAYNKAKNKKDDAIRQKNAITKRLGELKKARVDNRKIHDDAKAKATASTKKKKRSRSKK